MHIERNVYHSTWHELRQGLYTGKELQHARPSLIYYTHSKLNHTDEDLVAANGKPQPFKGRPFIYDLIAQAPPPDTRRVNPIAKRNDLQLKLPRRTLKTHVPSHNPAHKG
jgi:hypothetical protein